MIDSNRIEYRMWVMMYHIDGRLLGNTQEDLWEYIVDRLNNQLGDQLMVQLKEQLDD